MKNEQDKMGLTIPEWLEILEAGKKECDKIIKHYEDCLHEVMEQKNLMKWLDENEWATVQDYFVYLVEEAMKKVSQIKD
jgi:hypothetical protein